MSYGPNPRQKHGGLESSFLLGWCFCVFNVFFHCCACDAAPTATAAAPTAALTAAPTAAPTALVTGRAGKAYGWAAEPGQ